MAQKLKTSKANALSPDSPIPDKLYFKIGEVAKLVGVQPHVLRYWEREVSSIKQEDRGQSEVPTSRR